MEAFLSDFFLRNQPTTCAQRVGTLGNSLPGQVQALHSRLWCGLPPTSISACDALDAAFPGARGAVLLDGREEVSSERVCLQVSRMALRRELRAIHIETASADVAMIVEMLAPLSDSLQSLEIWQPEQAPDTAAFNRGSSHRCAIAEDGRGFGGATLALRVFACSRFREIAVCCNDTNPAKTSFAAFADAVSVFRDLQSLSLCHSPLTGDDLASLAGALPSLPNLAAFELGGAGNPAFDADALSRVLGACATLPLLTHLLLDGHCLGDRGATVWLQASSVCLASAYWTSGRTINSGRAP